jgi:hypothetical protein
LGYGDFVTEAIGEALESDEADEKSQTRIDSIRQAMKRAGGNGTTVSA